MQLTGVLGDIEKGQFVTVLEWMTQGNIMEYIRNNHVDRLELVRNFTLPPLSPLKCDSSCTGQPRV